MAEIAVVGSANLDLVVEVDTIPLVGETVLGGDLRRIPGGKGANQAVAAARLGRDVAMIGRLGDDEGGAMLRSALEGDGVDGAGRGDGAGVPQQEPGRHEAHSSDGFPPRCLSVLASTYSHVPRAEGCCVNVN